MNKKFALLLLLALLCALTPLVALADTATVKLTDINGDSSFSINSTAIATDGRLLLAWTDANNNAPYIVLYKCDDDTQATQSVLPAKDVSVDQSTTRNQYFELEELVPGHRYIVAVVDSQYNETNARLVMPAAPVFEDGKLNASMVRVSTEAKRYNLNRQSIEDIDRLTAGTIMSTQDKYLYGLRFELKLPELGRDRDYFVQIVMRSPDDYLMAVNCQQKVFSSGNWGYNVRLIGHNFFTCMYQDNGNIPVGTYTLELYFNGMLADTREFKVR